MMLAGSFLPPLIRAAVAGGINPTTLTLARYLLGVMLLGTALGVAAPVHFRIDRHGLLFAGLAGLLNGIGVLAFHWALSRVSASVASMLISINPLFVLLLLALRGEKFTYRNTVRMALGIGGIYLLIGPGGQVDGWGVLLVLFAVLANAGQLVMIQWFLRDYDTWQVTVYHFIGATLAVSTLWLLQGVEWHVPGRACQLVVHRRAGAGRSYHARGSNRRDPLHRKWPVSAAHADGLLFGRHLVDVVFVRAIFTGSMARWVADYHQRHASHTSYAPRAQIPQGMAQLVAVMRFTLSCSSSTSTCSRSQAFRAPRRLHTPTTAWATAYSKLWPALRRTPLLISTLG